MRMMVTSLVQLGAVLAVFYGLITSPLTLAQQVPQESCAVPGVQPNDVRLVPSESLNLQEVHTGRVEICINGFWSPVCQNPATRFWPEKNAQVVCKQLGFSGTLNPINSATVPLDDRAPRVFDDAEFEYNCLGFEDTLAECPLGDALFGCDPERQAYITCRPNTIQLSPVHQGYPREGDIRLVGDTTNGDGAVEYYRRGVGWLPVCPDSNWDNDDATVACRQLGYSNGLAENFVVPALEGSQQIITDFQCTLSLSDNPNGLIDCTSRAISTNFCSRAFQTFAGVNCRTSVSFKFRFIGESGLPVSAAEGGIIETPNGGGPSLRWGPWCGRGWDQQDAEAVCNFFGFDSAIIPDVDPTVESGLRPIWSTNVDCTIDTESGQFNTTSCSLSGNPSGYAACSPADGFAAARCGAKLLSSTVGAVIILVCLQLVVQFYL